MWNVELNTLDQFLYIYADLEYLGPVSQIFPNLPKTLKQV